MSAFAFRLDRPHPALSASGRWVEVLSHLDPKYGGMSSAVPALSRSLAERERFQISIAAFCMSNEQIIPDGFDPERVSFWPQARAAWQHRLLAPSALRKRFADRLSSADGIHIHGLWEASTAVAASVARDRQIPYIVSAHGMLEPWALAHSKLRKLLYSRLIERGNLRRAACLHALTHAEARHYVSFGVRSPIAVIPNGVDLPPHFNPALFLSRFPHLHGRRLVLFMARLHPKKGLHLLLDAWSEVASRWPEAHLVLAGPDADGTHAALEIIIAARGLKHSITMPGMLRAGLKWSALAAAEIFVLPSHSEGLSVSVLEAMGTGLPVILTDACNMPEAAEAKAGWEIPVGLAALAAALETALRNSPEDNAEIGARGHALVQSRFTWPIVAQQMAQVYRWVQGGPAPATVPLIHT